MTNQKPGTHKNMMEFLVEAEISRQLKKAPEKIIKSLNRTEVATYALNRLPTLYASSIEGAKKQKLRGQTELQDQIKMAVHQGMGAVLRDPLRMSTPLVSEKNINSKEAQEALKMLEDLLDSKQLSWQGLAEVAKKQLHSEK